MALNQEQLDLLVKVSAQAATQTAFTQVGKDLEGLKKKVLEIGAAVGSVLAFRNVIDSTMKWDEQVRSLQRNLGVTAEEASRLNFVGQEIGLTSDDVSKSFGILAKHMVEAQGHYQGLSQSTSGAVRVQTAQMDVLQRLGIATRNADGSARSFSDVLGDVHDRIGAMNDGLEKTGLLQEIFGRSGREMNRLVSLSREEFQKMGAEADALGLTLTEAGAAAGEDFEHNVNRLNLAMTGLKVTIGNALIPVLDPMIETLITFARDHMPQIRETFVGLAQALGQIWNVGSSLFLALARVATSLLNVTNYGRTASGIMKTFGDAFRYFLGIGKEVADYLAHFADLINTEGLVAALGQLKDDIIKKAGEILPTIGAELDKLGPVGFALKLLAVSAAVSAAAGIFSGLFGGILDILVAAGGLIRWSAGSAASPLTASLGVGIVLLAASAVLTSQSEKLFGLDAVGAIVAILAPLVAVQGITLARGLGASMPLALSVGAGLAIGLLAVDVLDRLGVHGIDFSRSSWWAGILGLTAAGFGVAIGIGAAIPLTIAVGTLLAFEIGATSVKFGESMPKGGDFLSGFPWEALAAGVTGLAVALTMGAALPLALAIGAILTITVGGVEWKINGGGGPPSNYMPPPLGIPGSPFLPLPPASGGQPPAAPPAGPLGPPAPRPDEHQSGPAGSPSATLDDIYARYADLTGNTISYEYAKAILDKGLTYDQVATGNPFMAKGGIVLPRPGGTSVTVGEAGIAEAIIPLDRLGAAGAGGQVINITINGDVDSSSRVRELAREVGNEILRAAKLQRNFAV